MISEWEGRVISDRRGGCSMFVLPAFSWSLAGRLILFFVYISMKGKTHREPRVDRTSTFIGACTVDLDLEALVQRWGRYHFRASARLCQADTEVV